MGGGAVCEWLKHAVAQGRNPGGDLEEKTQRIASLLPPVCQYSLAPLPAHDSTGLWWASPESSTPAIQPPGVKGWGPTMR